MRFKFQQIVRDDFDFVANKISYNAFFVFSVVQPLKEYLKYSRRKLLRDADE